MQDQLFFESVDEVLDYTIKACGGYKAVGGALFPDRAPDHAAQGLRDCLNAERREKLAPSEVLWIARLGRERGVHAYARFVASTLDYAPPVALTPADRDAARRDAIVRAGEVIAEQVRYLHALGVDVGSPLTRQVASGAAGEGGR